MVDHLSVDAIQEAIDEFRYEDALNGFSTLIQQNEDKKTALVKRFSENYQDQFDSFIEDQLLSVQSLLIHSHNIEPEDIEKSFFQFLGDREKFADFKLDNDQMIRQAMSAAMRYDRHFKPPSVLL